ncbi:MAG: hypothetical protein GX856_08330 [Gammaproteobacteria bacterium]|nr:hypothetical protein [Gammaproteobacteria bacterium]
MARSILTVEPVIEGWVVRSHGNAVDIRATKIEAIAAASVARGARARDRWRRHRGQRPHEHGPGPADRAPRLGRPAHAQPLALSARRSRRRRGTTAAARSGSHASRNRSARAASHPHAVSRGGG